MRAADLDFVCLVYILLQLLSFFSVTISFILRSETVFFLGFFFGFFVCFLRESTRLVLIALNVVVEVLL